jgi:glutamate racemase
MIGVFDSGLGGLSVLAAIARALPRADLVYLADTAHVPYGNKADEFIRRRVLAIGQHLVASGCTCLVAACNTATAAAVEALRHAHPDMAIIGVEPGVKPAAATSKTGRIAILATESTAQSARLKTLIEKHAQGVTVHIEPCPGWATHVETLQLHDAAFASEFSVEAANRITPLLAIGIDRLVLGCTHYAFLAPLLHPLIDGRAELIEVADAVAREVVRRAGPSAQGNGRIELHATARPERLHAALPALHLHALLTRIQSPARQVNI